MYCSTSRTPITSSLLKPVISTDLRFHSLTSPSASMPKIGALAVSIISLRSVATRESSASVRLGMVMSCPTPTTPMTLPAESLRPESVTSTCTCVGAERGDTGLRPAGG